MQDCPPLTFTDDVLAPAEALCGASLLAFVLPMIVIIVLRWMATIVLWRAWLSRFRLSRERLPVVPMLTSVCAVCTSLLLILISARAIDYHAVVFFLGVTSCLFCLISLITLRYYINITKRLVRFVDDEAVAAKAAQADFVLKFLFRVSESFSLGLFVSAVLSFFVDGVLWFRVVTGMSGVANLVAANSLAYQQYRILRLAMNASRLLEAAAQSRSTSSKSTPADANAVSDSNTEAKKRALSKTISKLRISILLLGAVGTSMSTFYLITASSVVPAVVQVLVVQIGLEMVFTWYGVWANMPPRKRKREAQPEGSVFAATGLGKLDNALVRRAGETEYQAVALEALKDEIKDCIVVADDGADASILTLHEIVVSDSDTLLAPLLGAKGTGVVLRAVDKLTQLPVGQALAFWGTMGGGGLALTGVVLAGVGPWWIAIASPLLCVAECLLIGSAISRSVFMRLASTAYFAWRLFACTVSTVVLGVALHDARAMLVPALWVSLVSAFCSDAFTGALQKQRLPIVGFVLAAVVLVASLIVAGQVPSPAAVTVVISSAFDYSFMQLARDVFVAQAIVLAFEFESIWRGAHTRRFLHVTEPVAFNIQRLQLTTALQTSPEAHLRQSGKPTLQRFFSGSNQRYKGAASELEMKSGFFVKERLASAGEDGSQATPTQPTTLLIHVNQVELKQHSALALHVFGEARGTLLFNLVCSRVGRVSGMVVFGFAWAVLLSFPFLGNQVPRTFALAAIPCTLILGFLRGMVLSRTLARLLITRRHFVLTLVFLTVWAVLASLVLRDERVSLVVFVFTCAVLDWLVDASLTIVRANGPLSRVWEKINCGLMFMVLSGFMVFGEVANPFLYAVFRPDLVGNASVSSDSPYVVDFFQSCVECVIFSRVRHDELSMTLLCARGH